jgi:magnesium transporter
MFSAAQYPPSRRRFRRRTPIGASPGTLLPDPSATRTQVHLIAYGPDSLLERDVDNVEELPALVQGQSVTWIDVAGLADTDKIARIGESFGLHPLALEDAVHVHQRGKVEAYADHLFIVARMVRLTDRLETEQLGIFLGKGFVITFQEQPGDCLDPVRERIRKGGGRLRSHGADYLTYALLDAVVDHYFPILEEFGERLEQLEADVVANPDSTIITRIHHTKRDLLALRRTLWPQREALNSLLREPSPLISEDIRVYLRDCYDHSVQIIELLETFREIAGGMLDVYLSSLSNRMNEIMKMLTMIATIFIPLSFIAGVYGMNFDPAASPWNMPELEWYLGYPAALLLMLVVGIGLLLHFRRQRWL